MVMWCRRKAANDEVDMNGSENIYSQAPGVIYADMMTTELNTIDNPQVNGVHRAQPDLIYSELALNEQWRHHDVTVMVYQCACGLDRPIWLTPFSQSPGFLVVVDLGIRCSTYTIVHYRRPSIPRRRGTNTKQFAI